MALFIFLNAVARGVLALLETVGPPVFQSSWKDKDNDILADTSQMMFILGAIGLIVLLLIDEIQK